MIIKYKTKKVNLNLTFSLIWLVFFFVSFTNGFTLKWLNIGWLLAAVIYFVIYLYEKKNQYGKIENDVLSLNDSFFKTKKVDLKALKSIQNIAGDIVLQDEKNTVKINAYLVEEESLKELENILKVYEKSEGEKSQK